MDIQGHLVKEYGLAFIQTELGVVAKHRPEIAKFAYEVGLNAPLDDLWVDKLVDFGTGASERLIRELYGLCNGLTIGATKFAVYGLRQDVSGTNLLAVKNIPFDINTPNFHCWGTGLIQTSFVVASSTVYAGKRSRSFVFTVDADDKISKRNKKKMNEVIERYESIEEFLKPQLKTALDQEDRW